MIRINVKHNYILHDFIQLIKQILLFIAVEGDNQKHSFADPDKNTCVGRTFLKGGPKTRVFL